MRPDRLIVPDPSPESSFAPIIAPVPTSGGDLPKLPSEGAGALSPVGYSYDPLRPVNGPAPSEAPLSETGGAVPFISSNPAVPLPTGVTDTATILPLPSPGGVHALVFAPFSLLFFLFFFKSLCSDFLWFEVLVIFFMRVDINFIIYKLLFLLVILLYNLFVEYLYFSI